MRMSFLGTGDAGGVPLYGCHCPACIRARTETTARRHASCALVESGQTRILLDAGLTDLTERFPPGSLSAIVLTHFHPDHVQGLFHLRWGVGSSISVLSPPDNEGCADLYKHHGLLAFKRLTKFNPVTLGSVTLTPLPLIHSKPTFGYLIDDNLGQRFAYLTDTLGLPPQTERFLVRQTIDALAIDCTHPPEIEPHNHNNLTLALESIDRIKPKRAYLTHISHTMDAWFSDHGECLPPNVSVAQDGLVI